MTPKRKFQNTLAICVNDFFHTYYIMNAREIENADRFGVILAPSITAGFLYDVFKWSDHNKQHIRIAHIGRVGRAYYSDYLGMEKSGLVPYGTADRLRKQYLDANSGSLTIQDFYTRHILWD